MPRERELEVGDQLGSMDSKSLSSSAEAGESIFTMGFGRPFGFSNIDFVSAHNTIKLRRKDGSHVSLLELCKASTPPCRLNPLLFNGHLQSMWAVVHDAHIPVYYKRRIFESESPEYKGTFTVDFVTEKHENVNKELPERTDFFTEEEFENLRSDDSKPMLITLHGLSGGSDELYVRAAIHPLIKNGWGACVVNSRGCAMSKVTSTVLYNARSTWDVRQSVKWLRERFPNRPLFAVGYSLGANILTNYVGEEGDKCQLKGLILISNPWNLEVSSVLMRRSFFRLNVYSRALGSNMKRLFERHAEQITKNPQIDVEAIRKIKFLHEFDRLVQCPSWGYPTEDAYYRDASSVDALLSIRIPTFCINALDDPISAREAIPFEEVKQNPNVVMCATELGGHLSWFEPFGTRWFIKPFTNFLTKMYNDIDLGVTEDKTPTTNGHIDREVKNKDVNFQPVRRKMDFRL